MRKQFGFVAASSFVWWRSDEEDGDLFLVKLC